MNYYSKIEKRFIDHFVWWMGVVMMFFFFLVSELIEYIYIYIYVLTDGLVYHTFVG